MVLSGLLLLKPPALKSCSQNVSDLKKKKRNDRFYFFFLLVFFQLQGKKSEAIQR
jgi:hypothetical protein